MGIDIDDEGNLYVTEFDGHVIRKIDPDQNVTTIAGTGGYGSKDGDAASATFSSPTSITLGPDGALYITSYHSVRRLKDGVVETIAGSMSVGLKNGDGLSAQFNSPWDLLFLEDETFLVADFSNSRIRRIVLPPSK